MQMDHRSFNDLEARPMFLYEVFSGFDFLCQAIIDQAILIEYAVKGGGEIIITNARCPS